MQSIVIISTSPHQSISISNTESTARLEGFEMKDDMVEALVLEGLLFLHNVRV
jgi:hypothetical protein